MIQEQSPSPTMVPTAVSRLPRPIACTDRELHSACEREQWLLLRLAHVAQGGTPLPSSPYGGIGEQLRVQERLWISDCGNYYAQGARKSDGEWGYDVIAVDGSRWALPAWRALHPCL